MVSDYKKLISKYFEKNGFIEANIKKKKIRSECSMKAGR